MKYAFIFGSNAFIVKEGVISYTDNGHTAEFLRIKSIYHDVAKTEVQSALAIDADIKDIEGRPLKLTDNQAKNPAGFKITEQRDRIQVTGLNGKTVLDVHQLDDKTAMRLEHNIIAELEVHAPIVVIRLRGDFMLSRLHIEIDNEKLFVSGNSYANSSLASQRGLQLTASGVVL